MKRKLKRLAKWSLAAPFLIWGFQNCGQIHQPGVDNASFSSAAFSHSPTPTQCTSCHVSDPVFTGIRDGVVNQMAHTFPGLPECATCHANGAGLNGWRTWNLESNANGNYAPLGAPGVFHSSLSSLPATCATCHSNEKPVGQVGTAGLQNNLTPTGGLFDHAVAANGTDCVSCHTSVPANVGMSWADGVYSHNPQPTTCISCHTAAQRPTGPVGAGAFDHAVATGGTGDCVACHATVAANIGKTWAQAGFSHSPVPTACASCHSTDSVYTSIRTTITHQMNHSYPGLIDCASCHTTAASSSNFSSWAVESVANGAATARTTLGIFHQFIGTTPTTCQGCHSGEKPGNVLVGSVGLTNNRTPTGGLFNHSTYAGTTDCQACHAVDPTKIGLSWASGVFSHQPQPTSCLPCHTAAQVPVGTVPGTTFDHANGGTGDCVSCHSSVAGNIGKTWSQGNFNHTPTPTACASCHASDSVYTNIQGTITNQMNHLYSGLPDCATCHASTASAGGFANWKVEAIANTTTTARTTLGVLHQNLVGTPTSCQTCHSNEKPGNVQVGTAGLTNNLTPTGGLFNHATYATTTDCKVCHTATAGNIGKTWAGGVFNHSPQPATCIGCHTAAQRPTGTIAGTGFDHANGGTGDCVSCHLATPANLGKTWAGATFSHSPVPTTCASCHSTDTTYTSISSTIKNQMNHSFSGLPDCATCHSSKAVTASFANWIVENVANGTKTARSSLGVAHAGFSTTPTSCQTCHSNENPGATAVGTATISGSTPSGGLFIHSTYASGIDCATCHKTNIGLAWSGGTYSHNPKPATCTGCHTSAQIPAGTVPNTADGFNHASTYGTECATCHSNVAANIGVSWSKGFFNHNNNNAASFTSCGPCHDTRKHHAGTNCTTCHTQVSWPKASTTGSYGGSFGSAN